MPFLRYALPVLFASLLAGCVSSGYVDPMKSTEGRNQARDAYISLGVGYLERGMTEKAKQPLRQALEIDPSSADAHATLAVAFQREMEYELADRHYRKALSLNGSDARLLNNYGGFLFERERYDDALSHFQKATEDTLYGERSRVFENLGLTYLRLERKEDARAAFVRSLRLNARQPRALLEMAILSYEAGDYPAANSYYRSFSQLSEQSARSLLLGARLAKAFDNRDRAASLGLQLRRLYPGSAEYKQYLSEQ
jgi:type IV pilus assembly protein PilF